MNVARFQIALNHESPGIVILGLDEFRKQILIDHNCTNSYGYYGRSYCNNNEELLEVKTPQKIVGVLENYIKSSPLAEELFVLWKLPGRDNNRQLSACHTACISAIIHCSTSNTAFVQLIIQRILHEHVRSIHNQLTSGDVNLVHATLGLLLCIARSAPQNALDSYQKLIATHSIFGSIIQKGKTVSWKPMANDMNKQDDGNIASGDNENGILTYGNFNDEVSTDARLFMVLILFHTLQSNGQTDDIGLFSSNSLIRRVLHAINNDTAAVLDVILSGIARLLKNSVAAVTYLPSLVDTTFIKKIFNLYYHENTEIEMLAKVFVFNLCELLSTKSLLPSYSGSHSGAIAITISNIVNIMDPVEHSSQREVS